MVAVEQVVDDGTTIRDVGDADLTYAGTDVDIAADPKFVRGTHEVGHTFVGTSAWLGLDLDGHHR